ncbi:MFS transporter [Paenibacillus thermotolerans]|uniref:MFS transporter n=1 Tax=Paenibacillus thermotolerans TaxID=3027807 RepID=UPI002368D15A|nr:MULTISPECIES: MFS transporter [unclassified Paenibacillus]
MTTQAAYKFRWWALACLVLSLLVIGFDMTILNVALPTMSKELNAGTGDLQWVMDAYLLVFATLLIPAGSLGDRYGRKKLLLLGLLLFGITSIAAGFATNIETVIVARACMGIGGAILMPLTFSILPTIFPPEEQGKASAIWAASSSFGLLIGPFLGGLLIEHFSWGSVFFINVPIVFTVLVAGIYFIPESKNPNAPRIDWLGMILSTSGFTLLIYGIIEAPQAGWFHSESIVCMIGGFIALTAFIVWQKMARAPMVDLQLFRIRSFTWATIALCFIMFVLNGFLFFVTQYLQFTLNNSAYETGIKLIPFMAGMVVSSLLCNRLSTVLGNKLVLVAGINILAAGLLIFSFVRPETGYHFTAVCLTIQGIGVGFSMAPAMTAVMSSLPIAQVGVGAGVNNALRQVSGTLGVAILGSIVSSTYSDRLLATIELHEKYADTVTKSIGTAFNIITSFSESDRAALVRNINAAFIDGMNLALTISAGIMFLGAVLIFALLPNQLKANETRKNNHSGETI